MCLAFYCKIKMAVHGRNLAYYRFVVVFTTFFEQAAKTWNVLFWTFADCLKALAALE